MERKYNSSSVKDVKRKLSFMNKKITDLHHQRKFMYKNSAKIKRMVHNQVNQLVRCLRGRERSLCSDVDDAYISLDSNISDELSKLQSVYARCQALISHTEDFKEKTDVLATIYSILSEINFAEKSEVKPLEFISDFEIMKNKANMYGYLEGDFAKKDFVLFAEEKGCGISDKNHEQFINKEKVCGQNSYSSNIGNGSTKSYLVKSLSATDSDCEDFQIIDLLDNMHCHDLDDFIMAEDESVSTPDIEKELNESTVHETKTKSSTKTCDLCTYKARENGRDFNPEEEWKQVMEMNKKLTSFKEMFSKLSEDKKVYNKTEKIIDDSKSIEKLHKYHNQNQFLSKEADNWLHMQNPEKEKTFEKINYEINGTSPAELIQKAFKPYLTKDNAQNWLSFH